MPTILASLVLAGALDTILPERSDLHVRSEEPSIVALVADGTARSATFSTIVTIADISGVQVNGRPVLGAPAGKQFVEIYLEVEDVDALRNGLKKKGVAISDPLTLQWWGDRTFKVLDPNGYEIWFYTNVAEPKPPTGAKLV